MEVNNTLVGGYAYVSSEGLDEFLKNLEVGLVLRKVLSAGRPTFRIDNQPDKNQWTVTSKSVFKEKVVSFRPQEKFQDETFDGRKCETTVDVLDEGRVMIWSQVCDEGLDITTTITHTDEGFKLHMTAGGWTCEMIYRNMTPEEHHQQQNDDNDAIVL